MFGYVKYPAGFTQFDYVNAAAPKGGTARQIALGIYDNFNMVVARVTGRFRIWYSPLVSVTVACFWDWLLPLHHTTGVTETTRNVWSSPVSSWIETYSPKRKVWTPNRYPYSSSCCVVLW